MEITGCKPIPVCTVALSPGLTLSPSIRTAMSFKPILDETGSSSAQDDKMSKRKITGSFIRMICWFHGYKFIRQRLI